MGVLDFFKKRPESNRALPVPDTIHSIYEMNQKAIQGWIAYRMASFLDMDEKMARPMMLLPFLSSSADENHGDMKQELLRLSGMLLEWIHARQDIYKRIKEARLEEKYKDCLLKVYEEIKNDISVCLPSLANQSRLANDDQDGVWEVYRDVIFAATQKKLFLIKPHEVPQHKQGTLLCQAKIKERADIPKARDLAKECLSPFGLSQTEMMNILLLISEAVTNILKHAVEGQMFIYQDASNITIVVEDRGPGIPLEMLPNATLLAGYSTKNSLGQGFTLMLKMADQIFLSTTQEGTILIFKFKRQG